MPTNKFKRLRVVFKHNTTIFDLIHGTIVVSMFNLILVLSSTSFTKPNNNSDGDGRQFM